MTTDDTPDRGSSPRGASFAPRDTETFFRAQARHRRVALILTALTFAGLAIMSAPLASLLFPAAFAAASALSNVLSLVLPTPDLGAAMAQYWERLFDPRGARDLVFSAFLLLSPGFLGLALLYRRARAHLRRDDGAALRAWLGARAPDTADPEERQLANLIEEMSIAAGVRAPTLYLTQGRGANAGAFALGGGVRPFIVVGRELLDRFDRAETAAIAGHCVGLHVISDDASGVRIAAAMIAIEMSGAILASPFDTTSRRRVAAFLTHAKDNGIEQLLAAAPIDSVPHPEQGWRVYATLPFTLAHATFHMVRLLAGLLFFSPALGFLIRRRRFLADATAIELTRQPDALAKALAHLSDPGMETRAAAEFPGNFVIASRAESALAEATASLVKPHPPVAERIARLQRMGAAETGAKATAPRPPVIVVILYGVVALFGAALVPLMIFAMSALTVLSFGIGMLAAFAVASLTGLIRP